MNIIEVYDDQASVIIRERTFPASCLIEDDDGIRIALIHQIREIPMWVWQRIHAAGASLIVAPSGDQWESVTIEQYLEHRKERLNVYKLPETVDVVTTATFPSYRDRLEAERPKPRGLGGFVHLHAHSEFSPLDGLSTIEEMVAQVVAHDQPALAVTDHGVCAAHPELQKVAKRAGIKPIFGIEANFTDDRFRRGDKEAKDFAEVLADYRHLILWAESDEGLLNLWAMNTEANREGFYGRPRMDWDTLERHSRGVMVSTACLRGPLSRCITADDEERARVTLGRLKDIFGDRVYVEIQTNQLPEQKKVNEALVTLASEYGLPLIAAVDSHYPTPEDRNTHRIWLRSQTNKDIQDESELFVGEQDYHLMDAAEVRKSLSYLPPTAVDEAIANTLAVAERCHASISGKAAAPIFSKMETEVESRFRDVERLVDLCMSNWHKTEGKTNPSKVYEARFEREMRLLIDKGFCGYFLMVSDYCRHARSRGILVGPGRGSGSGSLVAYLSDITEIDPIEADLMFERFLTEGRSALPDFDVDFPSSKRDELTHYIVDKYGEENVVRVGTHIRLKNKGSVRDMARVLKPELPNFHYPDMDAISKVIEEAEADKAGLGMSWEDLWDEQGEVLEPYRKKYPTLFDAADRVAGRLKTYGKHAAGMVIAPDGALTERLPLRSTGAGGDIVAEFDMESLEEMGLVKFDLLTLRTLDTIQQTVDSVRKQTGVEIDIYGWRDEYDDEMVWNELGAGHTLGVFQIETHLGTMETKRIGPRSLDDLADVITLIRPGPKRSGLTDIYFRRRMGKESVTYPDERLRPILEKTYGCMIYQEQVMGICMALGGYDSTEADVVRKILGKKQVEKIEDEGKRFLARCAENDTDPRVAQMIWSQMAEFARYGFNKAHAYGYAMLGYWTAWLKFHYPVQFIAAVLSTVDKGRIPAFVQEARRMGFKVLPPDVNRSGSGFTPGDNEVRYGLDSVKQVGPKAMEAILQGQPYESWDDFLDRKGAAANAGIIKTLARVGTFDSLYPNRRELELALEWETDGSADRCWYRDDSVLHPHGLPCTFDWSTEPVVIGKRGKPLKQKPLPKRCAKSCRNWTPPEFENEGAENYTLKEIMDIEMEMLGIHLSASPFDAIPDWMMEPMSDAGGLAVVHGSVIEEGRDPAYLTAGIVRRAKPHTASNGSRMGFLSLYAFDVELDIVVFSDQWKEFQRDLTAGTFGLAFVHKTQRGLSLSQFQVLD